VENCTEILQKIHSDIWGPGQTESLGKNDILFHLSMSIQDITEVHYLRESGEASTAIFEFISRVENLTGKKVKSFKSDNAKEYTSWEILDFFRNKGILHEKSIAYIHETNGMAERFNRTLVNMARGSILESNYRNNYGRKRWIILSIKKTLTSSQCDRI
jgi:hypothetical protein